MGNELPISRLTSQRLSIPSEMWEAQRDWMYLLILSLISGQPEEIENEAGPAGPGHAGPRGCHCYASGADLSHRRGALCGHRWKSARKVGTES